MDVARTAPDAFTVAFDDEEELRREWDENLSAGGLLLTTAEAVAVNQRLNIRLRAPGGSDTVRAVVVAALPNGIALAVDGDPAALLAKLTEVAAPPVRDAPPIEHPPAEASADARTASQWDEIRSLQRTQKIILATKADRSERALLVQDNDPQVLYSLLKNPRLTIDEVVRVAKSSFLTYQTAELIMNNGQWIGNLDVRVALVHNRKTPPAFALRLLETLPDQEVRAIARGAATSMALKTAALRKLQKRG